MSNFLRGLVQRGAGLPLPVTIRPAAGPQQAGSASVAHEERETNPDAMAATSLVRDESSLTPEVPKADFAERSDSTPHQVTVNLPGPRSRVQWPQMRPAAAPQAPITSPELGGADQPRPRRMDESAQPQETPAMAHTSAAAGDELAPSSRSMQESRPAAQPSQPKPEPRTVHQDAAVNFLPSRLAPRQERFPVVRLPQPAPSVPRIVEKKTTPEPRNIQVKIGRVEIRSSQPATVVKPTRPQSPGGFGDWKLARTYLDRSLR